MQKLTIAIALLPALFLGTGCAFQKSENPLSPTIAGPIPGVEISAPKILEPGAGWQLSGDQQPVTLLIENASSTGQRPLNYAFEVATDAGFSNKVFARDGVEPGDGGRTALRLPDPLGTGRTYYWRAKAQDGANTGPYSEPVNFNVFTPLAFDKPSLISPIGNLTAASARPELVFGNATRVGTPSAVSYGIEVALNGSFAPVLAAWQVSEQAGQTRFTVPADLPPGQQVSWHVRAFQGGTLGPWSDTQIFKTPVPIVVAPPTGTPGPGGACNGLQPINIVECRRKQYGAHMSSGELISFLQGVVADLNKASIAGAPFGLLRKTNGASCGGFACDIVCSGSGTSQKQWDVLGDSEGDQTPAWIGPKVYPDIRIDSCAVP